MPSPVKMEEEGWLGLDECNFLAFKCMEIEVSGSKTTRCLFSMSPCLLVLLSYRLSCHFVHLLRRLVDLSCRLVSLLCCLV